MSFEELGSCGIGASAYGCNISTCIFGERFSLSLDMGMILSRMSVTSPDECHTHKKAQEEWRKCSHHVPRNNKQYPVALDVR